MDQISLGVVQFGSNHWERLQQDENPSDNKVHPKEDRKMIQQKDASARRHSLHHLIAWCWL
jgi:hypothetical protein